MAKLELSLNKVIDVLWNKVIYKSTIQDIKENEVLITIPINEGIYLTLNTGDEIEQTFYDDKCNVFLYKTKIIGRYTEKDIPFYRVTSPYDIKKVQRRDYVRVNVLQVINYIKEEELKNNIKSEDKYLNALLLDLSGGGMRIKIKENLSMNDVIVSNLLYDGEKIAIKGKVVRVDKSEDKRNIYGIKFENIQSSTREQIIRTVFKVMRKQRELI